LWCNYLSLVWLSPRIPSLLTHYQASAARQYCKAILNEGSIFPGAKSDDYSKQFT